MASYEQNKSSKLWSVRFRIVDETGEHNKRLSGFRRKADAETAYREFKQTYVKPVEANKKGQEITFGQVYEKYKKYLEIKAKESSRYMIQRTIDDYVLPTFKKTAMSKINKQALENWQYDLWQLDLKHTYKIKIRSYFNSVLIYGHKNLDTPASQFYKVPTPIDHALKEEMQVWTPEEFYSFLEAVDKVAPQKDTEMYHLYFETLYLTGMRKGENLALYTSDINTKTNRITINKTQTNKVFQSNPKPYSITPPKTKSSVRKIRIPHEFAIRLEEFGKKSSGPFLFGGTDPVPRTNIDRVFCDAITASGVSKIRIHDLRHSHASLLISNKVSIVAVAKRLGHANIAQTLNTYAHMLTDDEELIVNILDNCTQSVPK